MFEVDKYQEDDEYELNKGFNEVFGLNRTLEEWKWKFPEPVAAVAKSNGKVIGQVAAVTLPLIEGGSVCVVRDIYVLPRYRRIGVLQKLLLCIDEQCSRLIAFPCDKTIHQYFMRAGWEHEFYLDHHVARITDLKIASKNYNWKQEDDFYVSNTIPDEYTDLWEKNKPDTGLVKDAHYFRWRYDCNRNKFQYLYNKEGLVVVYQTENRAIILEQVGKYIHAEKWLLEKGIECVEFIGYGYQSPYGKVLDEKYPLVAKNYHLERVTYGDTDIV
jgi:GNAT superfamily N-acetyltransferase